MNKFVYQSQAVGIVCRFKADKITRLEIQRVGDLNSFTQLNVSN